MSFKIVHVDFDNVFGIVRRSRVGTDLSLQNVFKMDW